MTKALRCHNEEHLVDLLDSEHPDYDRNWEAALNHGVHLEDGGRFDHESTPVAILVDAEEDEWIHIVNWYGSTGVHDLWRREDGRIFCSDCGEYLVDEESTESDVDLDDEDQSEPEGSDDDSSACDFVRILPILTYETDGKPHVLEGSVILPQTPEDVVLAERTNFFVLLPQIGRHFPPDEASTAETLLRERCLSVLRELKSAEPSR